MGSPISRSFPVERNAKGRWGKIDLRWSQITVSSTSDSMTFVHVYRPVDGKCYVSGRSAAHDVWPPSLPAKTDAREKRVVNYKRQAVPAACNHLNFQTRLRSASVEGGVGGDQHMFHWHKFFFIAVVKSDCWTKWIINWVNGLREFYANFLNDDSPSVSKVPTRPPPVPKFTHTVLWMGAREGVCACVWSLFANSEWWQDFSRLPHIVKHCWGNVVCEVQLPYII